ncbi:ABC transporter permease [Oscillatoria sp. FACHB-1407]|uniref:ABC transporter permease n=1 Tax=Oscillatoria sp. FACHB-1407 TaxID=2692847 RepID=UPI0016858B2D|nr:ABC transporter permease [Oscillatoria sp. FACHB-1407]MBD2461876.1 ABC transporter permease [Oscillatoria sp. FACHB-1407]
MSKFRREPLNPTQLEQGKHPWQRCLQRHENTLLALMTLTIFLIIWELLPHLGIVKPLFTSSPSRIVKAAQWLFANGFWYDIQVSATEFIAGFTLAVAVGIPLGICLGWYRRLFAAFDPFISTLYATPRVALLPLLILWLGIGISSKIAVVFLGAVFPILINVLSGMRTIDANLLKCARSFGANDYQIFTTLAVPSSIPFIIAGMRLAVGRGLVGVVVGELVAAQAGVGHMIRRAGATFQTDKVFVGIFVLALTGYVLTELLKLLETRFERWRSP